ncbi:hypothetical protein KY311_03325 [Candidatus Woesearchaeota archaeon]|nr:hypothetical protein [Candidatus Woesearchaeota archaeon]MBW3016775.1 hypothetical protein [Candidatus Woesearchaeota archaeon]
MNQTIKRFNAGAVTATVWENEPRNAKGKFNTISLGRRYKDKDGNWQHTAALRINDLPKASLVLKKAYEFLVYEQPNN